MPGPKATNRTKGRKAAPNTPSRKTRHRLDARVQSYVDSGAESAKDGSGRALKLHKPGSQNRKK